MPTRNRAAIVAVWWYEPDIREPLDTSIQGGTQNHSNHVLRCEQPDRASAIPRTLHNYWYATLKPSYFLDRPGPGRFLDRFEC
jgi:hypothetical protein